MMVDNARSNLRTLLSFRFYRFEMQDRTTYLTPYDVQNLLKEDFTGPGPVLAWYMQDGLGSVRQLVVGKRVTNSYTYTAWGVPLNWQEDISNRYTYTGREFNPESGNYHYRVREYVPTISRFLQKDKFMFEPVLYVYVFNNPIHFTDLYGLQAGWKENKEAYKQVLERSIREEKSRGAQEKSFMEEKQNLLRQVEQNNFEGFHRNLSKSETVWKHKHSPEAPSVRREAGVEHPHRSLRNLLVYDERLPKRWKRLTYEVCEKEWKMILRKYRNYVVYKAKSIRTYRQSGWWVNFKQGITFRWLWGEVKGGCRWWQDEVYELLEDLRPKLCCYKFARVRQGLLILAPPSRTWGGGILPHHAVAVTRVDRDYAAGVILDPWPYQRPTMFSWYSWWLIPEPHHLDR